MPKNHRNYQKTRHIALSGLLFALAMALSFIEGTLVIPGLLPGMKLGLANIVDTQVIGNGSAIRTAVIFFYLSNEGLSILENSAIIGLPVPEKLKDMLLQLTEEEHHNRESGENKADDNRNSTNSN